MRRVLFLVLLPPILTGCASGSGLPPDTERAIETYYAAHASEEGGRCPALFIEGFTRVEVVEDGPDRQVVDARYLYGIGSRIAVSPTGENAWATTAAGSSSPRRTLASR